MEFIIKFDDFRYNAVLRFLLSGGREEFFSCCESGDKESEDVFFCGNGKFFVILHHEPIGILAEIVDRS